MYALDPNSLTLEQEFRIVAFDLQVDQMSEEQAKILLKTMHRAYLAAHYMCLELMKKSL
jgi:hypothetical protein